MSNTVFPTGRVNCPTGHVAVGGGIERGVGPTGELVFETLGASAGNAGWEFTAFSNLGEDWGGTLSVSCLLFVGPNPPDFKTVTVAIACDGGSGSDPNCSGFAACPNNMLPIHGSLQKSGGTGPGYIILRSSFPDEQAGGRGWAFDAEVFGGANYVGELTVFCLAARDATQYM